LFYSIKSDHELLKIRVICLEIIAQK